MTGKGATGTIHVRVVYASPDFSWQTSLALPAGATVMQAVAASDVARRVPGYSAAIMSFGIFGQNCGEDRVLVDGDRVEIYRPLTFDPMESRSEEHTSELQSLMRISYAVFCLKNKNKLE